MLVSSDNQALLTGFGVSRMEALSAGFTTHPVKGSIRWQAREFFDSPNGESPAPTHTAMTDIWAFGMTVYVGDDQNSTNTCFTDTVICVWFL